MHIGFFILNTIKGLTYSFYKGKEYENGVYGQPPLFLSDRQNYSEDDKIMWQLGTAIFYSPLNVFQQVFS